MSMLELRRVSKVYGRGAAEVHAELAGMHAVDAYHDAVRADPQLTFKSLSHPLGPRSRRQLARIRT